MDTRLGEGFDGSEDWITSTGNTDILAGKGRYYYKFNFLCDKNCHVVINGQRMLILAGIENGFRTTEIDALVTSFVIEESGIKCYWNGMY